MGKVYVQENKDLCRLRRLKRRTTRVGLLYSKLVVEKTVLYGDEEHKDDHAYSRLKRKIAAVSAQLERIETSVKDCLQRLAD